MESRKTMTILKKVEKIAKEMKKKDKINKILDIDKEILVVLTYKKDIKMPESIKDFVIKTLQFDDEKIELSKLIMSEYIIAFYIEEKK